MAILTKDQILAAPDLKREIVAVPEWGGEVILQELSGLQLETYLDGVNQGAGGIFSKFLAATLVDEAGDPLFTQDEIAQLQKKNARVIKRLFEAGQRLNGLDKTLEDVAGNSETAPSGGSISA